MGIISFLIFGLLAGIVAKLIIPGKQPGGIIITTLIGVVGSVAAGWVVSAVTDHSIARGWHWSSFIAAVIGALVLLLIWGAITGHTDRNKPRRR